MINETTGRWFRGTRHRAVVSRLRRVDVVSDMGPRRPTLRRGEYRSLEDFRASTLAR